MVEALQNMAEPAGFKFSADKFEMGMAGGDATADELPDRGHDATMGHGVADDARARATPVRRQAHIRRTAAENVHGDGNPGLFRHTPEGLIIRVVIWLVKWGRTGNRHATYAHPGHALQLLDGSIDIRQR